jgi:hypothetical protein
LTACGDGATKKLTNQLNSSYDYDGKEMELTGFIYTFHGAMVSGDMVRVGLFNVAGQTSGAVATLKIKFGKDANGIYIPEKYHGSDIEIYDNTGEKHGYLTKCTVKGTVRYTNKNWKENLEKTDDPASEKNPLANSETFKKMREKTVANAKKAAEEREKKTGDPNDYSFEMTVNEISVAK